MLTDAEVDKITGLARLELGVDEKERLKKGLSSVLDYVERLDAVDTSGVEPLYQTAGLVNATRTDEPRGEFPMDQRLNGLLVGQAPDKKDRFVKVPSVLKKK